MVYRANSGSEKTITTDCAIREIEHEFFVKEQCVKRILEEMESQLREFRNIIQEKNIITNELLEKLYRTSDFVC
jgi:predicted DNA-binding protein YlxM (UPF0122 family)